MKILNKLLGLAISGAIIIGIFFFFKSCWNDHETQVASERQSQREDSIHQANDSIGKLIGASMKEKYRAVTFPSRELYKKLTYDLQKTFIEEKTPAIFFGKITDIQIKDSICLLKLENHYDYDTPYTATIKVSDSICSFIKSKYSKDNSGYYVVRISQLVPISIDDGKGYDVTGTLTDFYIVKN